MKRLICILIFTAMLLCVPVPKAQAAEDHNAVFEDALWLLDGFDFELNAVYMHFYVSRVFADANPDNFEHIVPAAEYEAVLYTYFQVSDQQLQQIRQYETTYDAEEETYTFEYFGGFGGSPANYEYLGYVTSGDGFDLYSRGMSHTYLNSKFDSYQDYEDYVSGLDYPDSITYQGVVYEGAYGDYIYTEALDTGRKYHVQFNGDVVKFISCENYTKEQLPAKFEPIAPQITVTLPTDGSVSLPNTDEIFADGTKVTVSMIETGTVVETAKTALSEIATEFVVYDFSAVKENQTVQPNGNVTVIFAVPSGYSKDVSVYYMDASGKLELLSSTVSQDGKSVTVTLEHFSTYILVDNGTKPAPQPGPSEPTEPSEPSEPSQPSTPAGTTQGTNPGVNAGTGTAQPDHYGDDGDNTVLLWIIIIVAVIAIGACVVGIVIVLNRKK